MNGVKEMVGFRKTFNISYSLSGYNQTDSVPCGSVDEVETSALLVNKGLPNTYTQSVHIIYIHIGYYCIGVFHWCSGWCPAVRAAL